MSKLYTTCRGDYKAKQTACASREAVASVQSYEGSVQVVLQADGQVGIFVSEGSNHVPGRTLFLGSLASLLKAQGLEVARAD